MTAEPKDGRKVELPEAIAERFAARPPVVGGRCRAVDVKDGVWVALALVEAGGAGAAGFTRRVRAVKRAMRVEHPGLARVRTLVQGGSTLAVAAELPADGKSLRGPLPVDEVKALARDVCAALAQAHARGVVHGGLDGASVVRGATGWTIVDLAAAHALHDDSAADERADVRGLGALLYEAATGAPPFEVPPLSLPIELRATLLRCLQQDPERRYGRVADVAAALGVAAARAQTAPAARRRGWRWIAVLAALMAMGAVAAWGWRRLTARAEARVAASGAAPAAGAAGAPPAPAPQRRVLLAVSRFSAPEGEQAWLGRAVTEMLVTQLDEVADFEVLSPPFDAQVVAEAARGGAPALLLSGSVEADGPALWINLRLYDAHTSATAWVERVKVARVEDLVANLDSAAVKLRQAVRPSAVARGYAELATASPSALRAYVEGLAALDAGDRAGAEKAWRHAAALDARFFHPRAHLAAMGADVLAEARPLAARAGVWGDLTLRRLEARGAAERVEALTALTDRYPRDATLAADLAAALRNAGRAADCVVEGERAQKLGTGAADVDLVWCRLESGDGAGALAAAQKLRANPILAGDVSLMLARWGDARAAYRGAYEAGDKRALARLALVSLHADGKCLTTVHAATEEDARVWAALSLMCGDPSGVKEAADWARRTLHGSHAGDEIAALLAGARADKTAYPGLRERADDAARWSAEGLDRARRFGPLLAAARAAGKPAEALAGFSAAPIDRHPWFEPPLLLDVALTKIDVGDAEDAALACAEILAAAPNYAPGHWCLGRAAEARKDWPAAFREYRELLDRWSDADPDNRIVRDAKRRIAEALRAARAPATGGSAAPAPAKSPPPTTP